MSLDKHTLISINFTQLPNKKWFLWYVTLAPLSSNPEIHHITVPGYREVVERIQKIRTRYGATIAYDKMFIDILPAV